MLVSNILFSNSHILPVFFQMIFHLDLFILFSHICTHNKVICLRHFVFNNNKKLFLDQQFMEPEILNQNK